MFYNTLLQLTGIRVMWMMPPSSEIKKKMALDYFEVHMNHTIMVKSFHTQSADRGFMDFKEP